jgi:uncharacterized membrane protein YdjX (TVP38/TMEM64 family)
MKKKYGKFAFLLVLLSFGIAILFKFDIHHLNPEAIRAFILSFGWWAPLLYIFLYTIRPLFFFPAALLTLSGGMTFGPWWGTFYDLIGASLGAFLAFGLSRLLGRETIQKWVGNRLSVLDDKAEKHGFRTIFTLRLIPLIPFDALNYGAGLSKIRFRDYAPATTLGMIPGAFAYNYLGHSLHHIFSPTFYMAVGMVLLLLLLPTVYKWLKKRKTVNQAVKE